MTADDLADEEWGLVKDKKKDKKKSKGKKVKEEGSDEEGTNEPEQGECEGQILLNFP